MADISTLSPDYYNSSDVFSSGVHNATRHAVGVLDIESAVDKAVVRGGGGGRGIMSWLLPLVYACGIVGNAVAIVCLRCGRRRVRNSKYLLMLTTLAANDLLALMGMFTAYLAARALPGAEHTRVYCGARVLLRVFGIGSVCIAVTMALERYLALSCVFVYQKRVTFHVICCWLAVGWLLAALLTCLPLLGFGLYWNPDTNTCMRYKQATTTPDIIYAILFITFGSVLCAALVYFNLAVIRALYAFSAPGAGAPVVRRYSHASARKHNTFRYIANAATAEEVTFSRLMAILSVLFIICWLPQMVTSVLYLIMDPVWDRQLDKFSKLSDVLMLLNYVLNPIVYVLSRQRKTVCQIIVNCFKRRRQLSNGSLKTSMCPETQLASDPDPDPAAPALSPLVSFTPDRAVASPQRCHNSHSF